MDVGVCVCVCIHIFVGTNSLYGNQNPGPHKYSWVTVGLWLGIHFSWLALG